MSINQYLLLPICVLFSMKDNILKIRSNILIAVKQDVKITIFTIRNIFSFKMIINSKL